MGGLSTSHKSPSRFNPQLEKVSPAHTINSLSDDIDPFLNHLLKCFHLSFPFHAFCSIQSQRRQVSHEFSRAKACAAKAKSSGDKAKQKESGQMIRDLKSEMERLGLSEAVAMAIVQQDEKAKLEAAHSSGAGLLSGSSGMPVGGACIPSSTAIGHDGSKQLEMELSTGEQPDGRTEGDSNSGMKVDEWEFNSQALFLPANPDRSVEQILTASDKATEECVFVQAEESTKKADAVLLAAVIEEEWACGFDIFEDSNGIAVTGDEASTSNTVPSADERSPRPQSIPKMLKKKHGGSQVPTPPREVRQPIALLSQHCHKSGWSQPRFTRLPPLEPSPCGQEGAPRYSVTLDMGPAR